MPGFTLNEQAERTLSRPSSALRTEATSETSCCTVVTFARLASRFSAAGSTSPTRTSYSRVDASNFAAAAPILPAPSRRTLCITTSLVIVGNRPGFDFKSHPIYIILPKDRKANRPLVKGRKHDSPSLQPARSVPVEAAAAGLLIYSVIGGRFPQELPLRRRFGGADAAGDGHAVPRLDRHDLLPEIGRHCRDAGWGRVRGRQKARP